MANKNFKVKNSITIPEPLAVTEGGTGQTSATNALNALLPVQTDNSGKYLSTDGTNTSWGAITVPTQDPNPQIFMIMGA
jgi:trimeric autotransporter adhesin